MSLSLTSNIEEALQVVFDEPQRSSIKKKLIEEAGNNLPFHVSSKPEDLDRIRLSILKVIKDGVGEEDAFALAKTDWRDLFMVAGFGYSTTEHENWLKQILSGQN